MDPDAARELARTLLDEALPDRWAHTQGVAAQARSLAPNLGAGARLVESAAWLHDIGYAPGVAATDFHPLDGARYLRDVAHAPMPLCALVAHHSYAVAEAAARGLLHELITEFAEPSPGDQLVAALTYSDMTVGPTGNSVTVDQRIAEILSRYPEDDAVHRSILVAEAQIRRQCSLIGEASRP